MYIKKLFLVGGIALTSSCTIKHYTPSIDENFATVSFSNLTRQTPELRIIDSCSTSKIDNALIEQKDPADISKHRLKIPIQRKITFEYKFLWIGDEVTELVPQGTGLGKTIKVERRNAADTCNKSFTFIPEENKHYEVYFGKGMEKCVLGVGEARLSPSTNQKSLYEVKAVSKQNC
ncbi:MAG: hypothetical protein OQK04_05185 [Kangiellaceae bacterium]|nr:hypothetical protein [Kangiellaceae bacterium]MCW8998089.1 hypothetical protein [Kangiellaceae bacterium]